MQEVGTAGRVVQIYIYGSDKFAELRGPAGVFFGGAHEAGVMVDGFGYRDFCAVARVVESEVAI